MDFNLSEEQEALAEMAREFLRERWPSERTRAALDARTAQSREIEFAEACRQVERIARLRLAEILP